MPNRCCNPFKKLNRCKSNLRRVSSALVSTARHVNIQLTCEKYICDTCRKQLLNSGGQSSRSLAEEADPEIVQNVKIESVATTIDMKVPLSSTTSSSIDEEIASDVESIKDRVIPHLNAVATSVNISPIKRKRLTSKTYSEFKGKQLIGSIEKIFKISPMEQTANESDILIQLKEKYRKITSKTEKLRILTTLPLNWTIANIMEEFGCTYYAARQARNLQHDKGIMSTPDIIRKTGLSNEVVQIVTDFYEHDDISRVCPGKRDYKTTIEDGTKVTKQKRLVLCNLKEAYQQFKTLHPQIKVGFSKFSSLRPPQCIFANVSGTHSVCVCKVHQNVILMFDAMKRKEAFQSTEINTYHDCLKSLLCKDSTNRCHKVTKEICNMCPGTSNLNEIITASFLTLEIDTLSYKQWINVDRCALETITKNSDDFVEHFCSELEALVPHAFIAKKQSEFLNETKTNLNKGEFVVISDFSENYSFVVQDEIQGFHWSNAQCTIHPFVVYFRSPENELHHKCFVIIAESLKHNHTAVYLFQKKLISYMKKEFNTITKIYFFSDGAGSQYKSRKNFFNISEFKIQYGFDCEWHFFASSHGKGPCDGIGGSLKRLASRTSLQRPYNNHITTAETLHDWAKSAMPKMAFDLCTMAEHIKEEKKLKNKYNNVKPIPGTHKYHAFIPTEDHKFNVKIYSLSNETFSYTIVKM